MNLIATPRSPFPRAQQLDRARLFCGLALLLLQVVAAQAATVTKVASGGNHSLFLKSDGSLWAMGYNGNGELGDGTTTNHHTAEQILPSDVTAIAAGGSHSLFLKSDGSLWAMGYNGSGQLGDGTITNHHTAEQIVAPTAPQILSVNVSGGNFDMSFQTISNQSYTVQANLDLTMTNWFNLTNFTGNGLITPVTVPVSTDVPQELFRVKQP